MTKKILRQKGNEWCELRIEIEDGRFSMSGAAGNVISRKQAKRDALDCWVSFFEKNKGEMQEMNERHGKRFTSPTSAAKFVLASDGEFHGIDVHHEDGNKVYVSHSWGQIRETINDYFPEAEPFWKWHLNDMHAECEHQEARGETYATHPSAKCPDCGYKLGSEWTKRKLPADVIAWAEGMK